MGIRGLTTFIAQNHDVCFIPYRLHDCQLIIDGNSTAAKLYIREFGKNKANHCAFGGDYDVYGRCVKRFFTLLSCCEIKAIVIFDGGKEPRKLATNLSRVKENIMMISRIRPDNSSECPLPLLMLQVFRLVARRSGAIIRRCEFEADEEIAALARELSCPVLSFDSDFYIHAVPFYIPFPTLATELSEEVLNSNNGRSIFRYLECSIFSVNKFLGLSGEGDWRKKSKGTQHMLQVEVLPLIAALLGNDYVKPNTFQCFLSTIPIPKSKCRNHRQRIIVGLLEWLRLEESLESAIKKILVHTKKGQRDQLEKIIRETVSVYVGFPSELRQGLNLSPSISSEVKYIDKKEEVEESNDKCMPTIDSEYKEIKNIEMENTKTSSEIKCSVNIEHETLIQNAANSFGNYHQSIAEENDDESKNDSDRDLDSDCALDEQDTAWKLKRSQLPFWFLERYRNGDLPPCFMDILMQRTKTFSPQVEDLSLPHSHAISFPILSAILRLLTPSIETPLVCLARVNRHAAYLTLDPLPKDSSWPAPEDLFSTPTCSRIKILLQSLNLIDDCEEKEMVRKLSLESLPSDWRLLALSLAYWRRNSSLQKESENFLVAACFCIVVLRVVDVRAGPPGRKSRKVRKEKCNLHMRKTDETSKSKLLEVGEENFSDNLRQDSDTSDRVGLNMSISEKVTERSQTEIEIRQNTVKELLQLVSTADCLRVCTSDGKLNQLRQVDEDTGRGAFLSSHLPGRRRPRPFNLTTVHCFSELQSVILHVGHINSLLGEPFVSITPHTSFSGTLAYNAYYEIYGKSCSGPLKKSTWEILLGDSGLSLEKFMDAFFKCVLSLAWGEDARETCSGKKTKRRKRNKKKDSNENCKDVMETNDKECEEPVLDPENKYSLLNQIEHC